MTAPVPEVDPGLVEVLAGHEGVVWTKEAGGWTCRCGEQLTPVGEPGSPEVARDRWPAHLARAVQGYVEGRVAAAVVEALHETGVWLADRRNGATGRRITNAQMFGVMVWARPGFVGTARHLRGRVFIDGGAVRMEVYNARSGQVLATDSVALNTIYGRGTGLPHLFDECVAAVAAARGSWTYEYHRKDLK